MSIAARQSPKFPWDYEVPNNAFWNSLDYKVGRTFSSVYTEPELSRMSLDASLPLEEKMRLLRDILSSTLATKDNDTYPALLRDVDYRSWDGLKSALSAMDCYIGDYDAGEKCLREIYENGPNGTKNMSALHQLSWVLEEAGKHAEAEAAAREVLPWVQGLPMLGNDSPQALGCMRVLVQSIWKQGRYAEAREWVEMCNAAIERLAIGKFAKYEDEERKQLDEDVKALEAWKIDRSSRM